MKASDCLILALIMFLLLKGLGLLKAWFNIDPEGITYTIDIGYLSSAALFAFLWHRLNSLSDKLSAYGERIARLEERASKSPS